MDTQELAEVLSSIQYKQYLNWSIYIVVFFCSGIGAWLASYFREKGKNYANKKDFENLKKQLKQNTHVVEGIKNTLSEKTWVNQQIWIKKQEAYEVVFDLLFHVKKYQDNEYYTYSEWENIHHNHPALNGKEEYSEEFESDKKKYEEKAKDPKTKKEAERLKVRYEESIASLVQIIEVKAIYLDEKVEKVIEELKTELSIKNEGEAPNDHFYRIGTTLDSTIDKIRTISKEELKIEA